VNALRVGIIGCGNMANNHAKAWTKLHGVELTAFADTAQPKAAKLAGEYGGHAYGDAAEMLDTERLDAVSVTTPPTAHCAPTVAALECGAHVLCEKPLAPSTADAAAMVDAADRAKRMLMTGFTYRFREDVIKTKELLRNGDIGKPLFAHNSFSCQWRGVVDSWFVRPAISGGGIVLDNASHSIDLFHHLFGDTRRVCASLDRLNEAIDVEDTALILTEHESGVRATIELSWSVPRPREWYLEIYGTDGTIRVKFGEVQLWTSGSADWTICRTNAEYQNGFDRMIARFVECIRTNTPLPVSGRDGLRAIEVIEQIYDQAPTTVTGRR
jgi:predicted dehydrogenase